MWSRNIGWKKLKDHLKREHLSDGEGWQTQQCGGHILPHSHCSSRPHTLSKLARRAGQCLLTLQRLPISLPYDRHCFSTGDTGGQDLPGKATHKQSWMKWGWATRTSEYRICQTRRTIMQRLWDWEGMAWFKYNKKAQGSERISEGDSRDEVEDSRFQSMQYSGGHSKHNLWTAFSVKWKTSWRILNWGVMWSKVRFKRATLAAEWRTLQGDRG